MNASVLLSERARAALGAVLDKGLRVTAPNLTQAAARAFPTLSEREHDTIAAGALRLHAGGAADGEGPVPQEQSPGDWPVRTVKRTKQDPTEGTEAKPKPVASTPRGGDTARILDALRVALRERPNASASELWDVVSATGVPMCARTTFGSVYCPRIRVELGVKGGSRRLGLGKQVARDPGARPAEQSAEPASPEGASDTPTSSRVLHHAASGGATTSGPTLPWEADTPAPSPAVPPVPPAPPAARATAPRPPEGTVVRIGGERAAFEALVQADGTWQVTLTGALPERAMGRVAAVVWELVVEAKRGAAA